MPPVEISLKKWWEMASGWWVHNGVFTGFLSTLGQYRWPNYMRGAPLATGKAEVGARLAGMRNSHSPTWAPCNCVYAQKIHIEKLMARPVWCVENKAKEHQRNPVERSYECVTAFRSSVWPINVIGWPWVLMLSEGERNLSLSTFSQPRSNYL